MAHEGRELAKGRHSSKEKGWASPNRGDGGSVGEFRRSEYHDVGHRSVLVDPFDDPDVTINRTSGELREGVLVGVAIVSGNCSIEAVELN